MRKQLTYDNLIYPISFPIIWFPTSTPLEFRILTHDLKEISPFNFWNLNKILNFVSPTKPISFDHFSQIFFWIPTLGLEIHKCGS